MEISSKVELLIAMNYEIGEVHYSSGGDKKAHSV